MDEYLNNRNNEILWNLLANPVKKGHSHTHTLQSMVSDFPQSGLLHALLSYTNGGQNTNSAAVYLNPRILYVVLNAPESLPILDSSQIIQQISADEKELPEVNTSFTEPIAQKKRRLNINDEAEKLIVGNIAATDYFAFDKAVNGRKQVETSESNLFIEENRIEGTETTIADENQGISKYNDDALPYTFLWWLNKTRKEHAGSYQPFKLDTSQAIKHAGTDELQQQYYENIFHLSSVDELDRGTGKQPMKFDPKSKEDRLIKRFIVEEPHISTPSADKLDTENKARKSAEDQDELVTETLARIYIDQMLYHKAIVTYKKLMLKFPGKSRYFADQIEQLERKTN